MKLTKQNDLLNEECSTWTVGIEGKLEDVEKMIKMLSDDGYGKEMDGGDGERNGTLNTVFGTLEGNTSYRNKTDWEKDLRKEYKKLKKQI